MEAGHSRAQDYPIGMVWDEAKLVVERRNQDEATRVTLLQMAISSVVTKNGGRELRKALDRLTKEL